MDRMEEMRRYALFVNSINRQVFRGGLRLNALKNPGDISTIVTVQDMTISNLFLNEGIGLFEGVQAEYSGAFSEEMDSPYRTEALEAIQFDPIDGTGDLKFSADSGKPYGATNLVSKLERNSTSEPFTPTAGMIFDFIDELVLIGDGSTTELYRMDPGGGLLMSIKFDVRQMNYMEGEPIRLGIRTAYPHEGFDAFHSYLRDEKKDDIRLVTVGGAGRMAMQLFRTNMNPEGGVPADWDETAIDVMLNYQDDHKTWDLDPTQVIRKPLKVTKPTNVYGGRLTANAAAPELKPGAWHTKGYLYSARGQYLHDKMASYALDFEKDTGLCVLRKSLK